jgi:hypothetical protein
MESCTIEQWLIRSPAFGTDERVAEGEEVELVNVVVALGVAGDAEVSCRFSITASVKIYLMISFAMKFLLSSPLFFCEQTVVIWKEAGSPAQCCGFTSTLTNRTFDKRKPHGRGPV